MAKCSWEELANGLQTYSGCAAPATLVETVALKMMVAVSAEAEELARLDPAHGELKLLRALKWSFVLLRLNRAASKVD